MCRAHTHLPAATNAHYAALDQVLHAHVVDAARQDEYVGARVQDLRNALLRHVRLPMANEYNPSMTITFKNT